MHGIESEMQFYAKIYRFNRQFLNGIYSLNVILKLRSLNLVRVFIEKVSCHFSVHNSVCTVNEMK